MQGFYPTSKGYRQPVVLALDEGTDILKRTGYGELLRTALLGVVVSAVVFLCSGCETREEQERNAALTRSTSLVLMDWHISGLWVINSPVAWVRVFNNSDVPITEVTFEYSTFDNYGKPLDKGTFTIEGTIPPRCHKDFIELYLGLVDLYSEHLSVRLLSVKAVH